MGEKLMATIRTLSNNKFRADIRRNNKFIQAKTFSTKRLATQWAAGVEANIETILNLKPKKLKKLTPAKVDALGGLGLFTKLGIELEFLTFATVANEYAAQWTGKCDTQPHRVDYWANVFGNTPLKAITTKDVKKAVRTLATEPALSTSGHGVQTNKPRNSNTVIRYKAVLSAIFKYAIAEDYLKHNPVETVFVKPTPNKIERYLSDNERITLLYECKQSTWDKMHLLILLAITTGMRKSEMMNLRWTDINFTKNLATLRDTKNGESRVNVLPAITMEELNKFREIGTGLIFNSPTIPRKPFEFRKQWYAALKRANITEFRFHDLRHTAASYLVMGGATLQETAQVLGHKSTQTTERYAHLSSDHKAKVVNRVMDEVFGATGD